MPGHLGWDPAKKSYRMSEYNGDLRVVSFSGETGWSGGVTPNPAQSAPPSPATLSVLRESSADKQLKLIGRLPNAVHPAPLGKSGEQIYAVRFLGTRGYVVTFRRSDPLYVLDLADPTNPKAVGELQVAGFSDYLLPMSDSLLLGVGKDASTSGVVGGVKVALFDVADPAQPRLIDAQVFGSAGSSSGLDHSPHGIDLFARGGVVRIALPLSLYTALAQPGARGLQRLEVNTQTRTLAAKAMIAAPTQAPHFDLSNDRAVQIEDHVYYFAAGEVGASSW